MRIHTRLAASALAAGSLAAGSLLCAGTATAAPAPAAAPATAPASPASVSTDTSTDSSSLAPEVFQKNVHVQIVNRSAKPFTYSAAGGKVTLQPGEQRWATPDSWMTRVGFTVKRYEWQPSTMTYLPYSDDAWGVGFVNPVIGTPQMDVTRFGSTFTRTMAVGDCYTNKGNAFPSDQYVEISRTSDSENKNFLIEVDTNPDIRS